MIDRSYLVSRMVIPTLYFTGCPGQCKENKGFHNTGVAKYLRLSVVAGSCRGSVSAMPQRERRYSQDESPGGYPIHSSTIAAGTTEGPMHLSRRTCPSGALCPSHMAPVMQWCRSMCELASQSMQERSNGVDRRCLCHVS